MTILAVILLFCAFESVLAADCPELWQCCYDQGKQIEQADCSNASLNALASGFENFTNSMRANFNNITALRSGEFARSGLYNLEIFMIRHNNLVIPEEDTFQGLENLSDLDLRGNSI
jgi:hypothetical protein